MVSHTTVEDNAWRSDIEQVPLLKELLGSAQKVTSDDHADLSVLLSGKKILLATESLGPINGVSRTTSMLIDFLRRNGVQVAVVAPEIKPSGPQTDNDIRVDFRLNGYALPYNPDLSIVYPLRVDRIFSSTFRPDLVYLASPASVGFQVMLQLRQMHNGPPVLCNFQTDLSGYSEILFPAYMAKYAVWILGVVQGFLFRHPSVKTIFYPSDGIRQYLKSINVQSEKLIHLGRGVDTAVFDPVHRDVGYRNQLAPNGEIILLTVSRLAPEKGYEFLARVAIKLAGVGVPFKLVVVGGNRNPLVEAEVQRYFDEVKERVVFTGFLTGTALGRMYAAADLFLHCSITETFGLVVLEAMASGVPVIARDQGGPSEIVQNGKTGYLVHPDAINEFVNKIRLLYDFEDVRKTFSINSRQVALETTWEGINRKAAWQIAIAIKKDQEKLSAAKWRKVEKGWIWRSAQDLKENALMPFLAWIRMIWTVVVVSIFWMIAVTPLIIHGTFVYRPQ